MAYIGESITTHRRLWIYRIETFFLLALLSVVLGRTPIDLHNMELGYNPNWSLNRFLWLPYAGSGDMPWELEDVSFLGYAELIIPSILTILWWALLTAVCFETLRRTYTLIKHRF